ncbi:PAS domain S-box-containing protein/diguanylate cyclase (GGDEF)-like protein [Thioalkalivibrio sp. ALE21]|uniref:putative bifunctional diguanylate cyclase/phosphodiesterase n=1 Tax=Thioalkalivibrio sp. ALE21 TaxID=1158175 RepID=UPI000D8A9974|nr:GGDEF and EAL domain-containing protein [Thioalkalivibrio sp. ALE21]PYG02415.1 PAS domain S-box-containing protein/diguanylate cyclase (GGDEF)-like protein [Thioalkalivibrio sp. ALE21]
MKTDQHQYGPDDTLVIDYRSLIEDHPHIITVYRPDTTILFANRMAREYFGADLVGRRWIEDLPPEHQKANLADLARFTPEHPVRIIENPVIRADGTQRWVEWTSRAFFDEHGRITHLQTLGIDSTERHRAREALEQREAELAEAQRIAHLGSWISDFENDEIRWSDEVYRIFGMTREQWGANHESFITVVHPDDREHVQQAVNAALRPDGPEYDIEHRIRRPDGTTRVVYQRGTVSFDDHGRPRRMAGIVHDITERRETEDRLQYLTWHDPLTGLPNRELFLQRLNESMEYACGRGWPLLVVHLGLDRFKGINEGLGHTTGDALLQRVSQRLEGALEEGDTLARIGGDEFGIVLGHSAEAKTLVRQAAGLVDHLKELFAIDGEEVYVPGSAGAALYPDDGSEPHELLRRAGAAMDQAKREGGNGLRFCSGERNTTARARVALEGQLRRAVYRQEGFFLHYQPRVEAGNGRITGLEALLRWQDPNGQVLSPGTFIPVLEETGLIRELGEWILREACLQHQRWKASGLPSPRISINLAAPQFRDQDLPRRIRRILAETGTPADALELEVTESMLMADVQRVIHTLGAFRDMGLRVALDDFGTGYSSLAYLQRFPLDVLKIDRSFVRDLDNGGSGEAIVRTVLSLAANLNLETVAEGVENLEQQRFLEAAGCDTLQGFLLARPAPAAQCAGLLARGVIAPDKR